jgi:hypothetical protein
MDLLFRSYATQGFVAFEVVRTKEKSHCDQHPTNQFFLLTIEVIGCLDKQADVFLHACANVIWNFKGPKGPPFPVLVTFFCQKISITL